MKVTVTGRFPDDLTALLNQAGFEIVSRNPDLIITHGGDGTLLGAERAYPGVPKFPVRDSRTAPLCELHKHETQIEMLKNGQLKHCLLPKLHGVCQDTVVKGINDVFIHNYRRVSALRYGVVINDELYAAGVVGDAVGVATIHGSTAYYRSITNSVFRVGIGLAFSNSTEVTNHLVLPDSTVIKIMIIRGPAVVVADNGDDDVILGDNDEITIYQSDETADIYGLEMFMCPDCRRLRHNPERIRGGIGFSDGNCLV